MEILKVLEKFGTDIAGGGATLVLIYFGWQVISHLKSGKEDLKQLLTNHIEHIEKDMRRNVEHNEEIKGNQEEQIEVLKEIRNNIDKYEK